MKSYRNLNRNLKIIFCKKGLTNDETSAIITLVVERDDMKRIWRDV